VIGRALEVFGLALPLVGLVLGILQRDLLRLELAYLALGAAVFYLGYWLERPYRR